MCRLEPIVSMMVGFCGWAGRPVWIYTYGAACQLGWMAREFETRFVSVGIRFIERLADMSERREKVGEVAAAAKHRVESKLGQIWWAILLRGVLALGLAVCAFVWPEKTLSIFVKLLGAYFLIDGAIGAVSAYRSGDKAAPLLQAVVSLAIGLVLLLWTDVSGKLFLILVGIWLVLQGISLLLAAFRMESADEERGLAMIIGAVMAAIGAVFIFWTNTGVVVISWLIGLGALVIGCLLIYLATRVKKIRSRINQIGKRD